MKELTLAILKPDTVAAGNSGKIIDLLERAGFELRGLRMLRLTINSAASFYAEHRGKAFFEPLLEFITSGPVVVAALTREDAVSELRRIIGATDPAEAEPGTVRALYAESKTRNAIHASDSYVSATRELNFFFSDYELIENGHATPKAEN